MEALIFTVFAIILLQIVGPIVEKHRRRLEKIRQFERWGGEIINASRYRTRRKMEKAFWYGTEALQKDFGLSGVHKKNEGQLDAFQPNPSENRISRAIERNLDQLGPKPKQALFGGGDE